MTYSAEGLNAVVWHLPIVNYRIVTPYRQPAKLSGPDDNAVVKAVLAGAKEEFRVLVERHQDMIFSLIARQVGETALAEELAQEVFVKAFLNLKQFRHEARFSTWLVRIALNHVRTWFSSRRFKQSTRTDSFNPVFHEGALRADGALEDESRLLGRFREAFARLPSRLRDVLCLCAFEGKSYEEAAAVLRIPVGTVRSRLNKARYAISSEILEDCE